MRFDRRECPVVAILFFCLFAGSSPAAEKPDIRAVTAFVNVDRNHWERQIRDTIAKLRQAKGAFEKGGYAVQTLRIATQPFPQYMQGLTREQSLALLHGLDGIAAKEQISLAIGPAMLTDNDDPRYTNLLTDAFAEPHVFVASLRVAAEDGVHWISVRAAAHLIRQLADRTPDGNANFGFAATAMLGPYGPFFPGAFSTGAGTRFAIAWQAANVVAEAMAASHGDVAMAEKALAAAAGAHARGIESLAKELERSLGWTYMGIDVSPAPNGSVSIGRAIENFTGVPFGSSGTLSAAALITRVMRGLPVQKAGYSGMMVPILEDEVLAQRWGEGHISIDGLLAYSAVCGTGLDTVPLPGNVSEEQLARIIGDMAMLAFKWNKPLTARLMPARGKKPGDRTEFQGRMLVNTIIQPLP